MNRATARTVAFSTLLAIGCSRSPTEPVPQQGVAVAAKITLTRLEPTEGIKHAALASFVVTELRGRTVTLEGIRLGYFSTQKVTVSGFASQQVGPRETARFDVTLTSTVDIPCSEGLELGVAFDNGIQEGTVAMDFGCDGWLF